MDWPEVRLWRKATRTESIAARVAIPSDLQDEWTAAIVKKLRSILESAPQPISFYWPLKAEPDFRPFMREIDGMGGKVALPVALKLGEPMTFRPWHRGCPMERGIWNIPIPATREEVIPRTIIAPLVGYDSENYRLGYGGGFFDRTLAKLGEQSSAIGVGYSMFRLPSIYPQDHDIPMTSIITEIEQGCLHEMESGNSRDEIRDIAVGRI